MLLCATMVLSFSACSDDDEEKQKLSQKELSLTAGESVKLSYNGENCTWSSEQPLIAEVDNSGNVTANRVGETVIYANDETCNVTVIPKYNTYMEPYMEWGASKSVVRSYMSGYTLGVEEDNILGYIDDEQEFVYFYQFENNSLTGSGIVANILSHGTEITNFLLERYVVVSVDEEDNMAILLSIDAQIGIGVLLDASSGLIWVMYMPFDSSSRANGLQSIFNKMSIEIMQQLIPYEISEVDEWTINELTSRFTRAE